MTRFKVKWNQVGLIVILAISAFLNIWDLNREGYGNSYYAAAIKSMLTSWHNFFYNSFDPAGFITIDKPPVGFWIQALFAWIFGFHGWTLLLPQALAATASVLLLYVLVRRMFGTASALIAAAVLAVTPIAVAVARTNEVDSTLVLVMLLATWCLWKAIETKRLRWLVWVGVLEGIGFNIKMMEAYLVLPAIYTVYWFAVNSDWRRKLLNLTAMTAVMAILSFSWAGIVDMTPAQARPYVGSTQNNSEISLIFGYNGLERLTGAGSPVGGGRAGGRLGRFPNFPGRGSGTFRNRQSAGTTLPPTGSTNRGTFPPNGAGGLAQNGPFAGPGGLPGGNPGNFARSGAGGRGFGGVGGGFMGTGNPGVLRLFQAALSGQISWLLPIALLSSLALLRNLRWRRPLTREESGALFWLAWVLPMAVFFSIAGFFHQYYLVTMAPGIAALTGIGLVKMWTDFRTGARNWKWLLPVVFILDLYFECRIVLPYAALRTPLITASVAAAVIAMFLIWVGKDRVHLKRLGLTVGVLSLLVSPGYWALTPLLNGVNEMIPVAGPSQTGGVGNFGAPSTAGADSGLEAYLVKHYSGSKGSYLLATTNATVAAPFIIDTGLPVMAMGGFLGSDPAITTKQLQDLTKAGKLKYFLLQSGGGGFLGGSGKQSTITQWIVNHSKMVPSSAYSTGTTGTQRSFGAGGAELYEYVGSK